MEVWIKAFSTTPEQINKFDWLGREIGQKWSFEQQWSLGREEVIFFRKKTPFIW